MIIAGDPRFDLTVIEMITNLMSLPPSDRVEIFGSADFFLRERIDLSGGEAIAPLNCQWLELEVLK